DAELVAQHRGGDEEWIALLPVVELSLGAVFAGVAARMADEAIGAGLDELGALSAAHALDDLRGGRAHGTHVHPVDLRRAELHRGGARHDPTGRDRLEGRVLAVAVVLAHEYDGQR